MIRSIVFAAAFVLTAGFAGADAPKKRDVPRYIKQLQSSRDARLRADAAEALGERGAIKKADVLPAINPLLNALKDRDINVRRAAAEALGKIVPDNQVAVKPLIGALKDSDLRVRMAAATALGNHGSEAQEAVPQLRQVMKETGRDKKKNPLRRAAGMALRSIMGKPRKK